MPHISIVSPVYQAEHILPKLISRIETSLNQITQDYEIILVEDCGPDNSWKVIEELSESRPYVKGIKLSRNFGQHYAITCGLDHAKGDWFVVMDCDLQDRPEEIINLYNKAKGGYDIVFASRSNRQDSYFKKIFSKIFYRTLGYLTGTDQDETVANFGIYNKKVIKSIVSMRENIRFFPSMVKWVGYNATKIHVKHSKREEGKSNYNFSSLLNLGVDIMLAYSDKPLKLVVKFGFLVSGIALIFSIYTFFKWKLGYIIELGYSSIIISIWLLIGFLIIVIGIVGTYIGKIFENSKGRPIYIVDKKTNKDD